MYALSAIQDVCLLSSRFYLLLIMLREHFRFLLDRGRGGGKILSAARGNRPAQITCEIPAMLKCLVAQDRGD
jgi:hypothetical protein